MRALYMGASLLLLLVCPPCILCAEGLMIDGSADSAVASSGVPAGEPWWTSAQQSSIRCLQLQQKSCLHDATHSREVFSTIWAVLVAVIPSCLVISLAVNVRQKKQRAADLARYRAQEQADDERFRGLQRQACEYGRRAVMWANLSNELGTHNKQLAKQLQDLGQVACSIPPVIKCNQECQTGDDLGDVLAPSSPRLVGEVASPRGEPPQLQGEASMPQLQGLVAATSHSDAAVCISDQCNAGTAAAAASSGSGMKGSSPSKLHLWDVPVQEVVQLVAQARSSPLAAAGKVASAEQQQLGAPLAGAAVQQQAISLLSVPSIDGGRDRHGSPYVTQDELRAALAQVFNTFTGEVSKLKSELKAMQQQLQQQRSPAITPLMPSSGYVTTMRGPAGTPAPFQHASTAQLGSGLRFSAAGNASAPRSCSMLDASGAAASSISSSFKGLPVPGQHVPGSVGSTPWHSPQGLASGTPSTAPGSAAGSAAGGWRCRTVGSLPMQPLMSASSPAGTPTAVQHQQPQAKSAAKELSEAIDRAIIRQREYEAAESKRKEEAKKADGLARA
ncbi:hypothetical protein COO60DRAFT_473560 [Scenedesmus sp. NREL 46B-D3]|nr:hypothetical protein COO60DRAFT_473560 [Scenedesmus sp. NREL 46B-D3]